MTAELVGKEISWNFGETTATGGLFTRGSAESGREKTAKVNLLRLFARRVSLGWRESLRRWRVGGGQPRPPLDRVSVKPDCGLIIASSR